MSYILALLALVGQLVGATAQDTSAIRIGVLNDQSGVNADLGGSGSVIAARMAVEEVGGAVLGRPVQVLVGDHQNKPDIGLSIARQWYDSGVTMIADNALSSVALGVQALTREKNKIAMFSGAGSSDLTGKACSPNGIAWTYDTYALSAGTAAAEVATGGDTWFFITPDYAFGKALQADTTAAVQARRGKVLGSVLHPLQARDLSSFLLQAQSSGARVIALANTSDDLANTIKQAKEFGVTGGQQRLVSLFGVITDINSIGLEAAQGLRLTEAFYWDLNDGTREWSKRFFARHGRMPTSIQAGVYGSVLHYLRAVKAAGTTDTAPVLNQMRELRIHDMMTADGYVREDGRVMRDFYLFQVKAPSKSEREWDYYEVVARIKAEDAARPLAESACPLVKK